MLKNFESVIVILIGSHFCVQIVPLENNGVISVDWTDDALDNLRDEEEEQQIDLHPSCNSSGACLPPHICALLTC